MILSVGGGHVNSALDLGGSREFRAGLDPVSRPPPNTFQMNTPLAVDISNE